MREAETEVEAIRQKIKATETGIALLFFVDRDDQIQCVEEIEHDDTTLCLHRKAHRKAGRGFYYYELCTVLKGQVLMGDDERVDPSMLRESLMAAIKQFYVLRAANEAAVPTVMKSEAPSGVTEERRIGMTTLEVNLLKDILKPSFTEELNDVEAQEFFNNCMRDFKAAGEAGDAGLGAWFVFYNAYWSALEKAAHIRSQLEPSERDVVITHEQSDRVFAAERAFYNYYEDEGTDVDEGPESVKGQ